MISSFGTEESVLQRHDKANNAVCLQCMVRVLHWEFAKGFRLQKRSARIILDGDTRANSDELFTRLDRLPLHLEVKVNICVQVHKRINGRSPGYMSDLLVLNSDINERNNRNSSLNLVCPGFKRETEG